MAPDPQSTPTNCTSEGGESPQEKGDVLDLTLLPNELLEKVFAHLDLRTFKSIRLVCSHFKRCADTNEALSNFRIAVRPSHKSGHNLKELLSLSQSLPWSNLLLTTENWDPDSDHGIVKDLEKVAILLKTRNSFGLKSITCPILRTLSTSFNHSSTTFEAVAPFLLHCSDTLERVGILKLTELRLKGFAALEEAGVRIFPRLKYLSIAFDVDVEYIGKDLDKMMDICPQLRRLDLLFADQDEHPMSKESFESSVLYPILSYLQKRLESPTINAGLTIHFGSIGQKASLPFNFSALEKLLQYSKSSYESPSGIHLRLENVPFLALPTKRSLTRVQASDPEILARLNYTVKSIIGTNKDLKLSTMEIERDSFHSSCRHFMPPEAVFSLIVHLPTGNKIYLTCPSQLLPTDVQRIVIVSENTRASLLMSIGEGNEWGEGENKGFIEDLLSNRPALEELRIVTRNDRMLDLPFLAQESVNLRHIGSFKNFPNLKVLHLDYWGRVNEDFWELYELEKLEELVLRKCGRFKDSSVLGTGQNSMTKLTNLKRLVLEGFWSITDVCFVKVFSKMGLKTLQVWDQPNSKDKSITMRALHCLPNSVCGATLEHLKINRPYKTSLPEIRRMLQKCRTLKRVELFESVRSGAGSTTTHSMLF